MKPVLGTARVSQGQRPARLTPSPGTRVPCRDGSRFSSGLRAPTNPLTDEGYVQPRLEEILWCTLEAGDGGRRVRAEQGGALGADAPGRLQLVDLDREVLQLGHGVGDLADLGELLGILDQLHEPGAFLIDLAARD